MTARIRSVEAMEILDSRGKPTVRVTVTLADGIRASSSVPSGASTGEHEAVELRDGDPKRYGGQGVLRAVRNVNDLIAPALAGRDAREQAAIDRALIELDGTHNKARLGANAILGVSQAVARAAAQAERLPLHAYLGGPEATRLPVPMMNVINGGKHADSSLDFQEFMIVPRGAPSFAEALRYGAETFHALRRQLAAAGYGTAVGDEGGFAPRLLRQEEACERIVAAIEEAGYRPGSDIAIALDPAATSFYEDGRYRLTRSRQGEKTSAELTALYKEWIDRYPIVSLEDGLAENDWDGFRAQTAEPRRPHPDRRRRHPRHQPEVHRSRHRGAHVQCRPHQAEPDRHRHRDDRGDPAVPAGRMGLRDLPSLGRDRGCLHRRFRRRDGRGQIKTGSACRGERTAKYNRLLEIERELGARARFGRG